MKKIFSLICALTFAAALFVNPTWAAGAAEVSGSTTLEFETLFENGQISYTNIEPGKSETSANSQSAASLSEDKTYMIFQAKTRYDGVKFTVDVKEAGYYDIAVKETRVSSYSQPGRLYLDGIYITFSSEDNALKTGNTNNSFVEFDYGSTYLTAGEHTVCIIEYASLNKDYYYDCIKFTKNQYVKYLEETPSAVGEATITNNTSGLLPYYQSVGAVGTGMEFSVNVPETANYKVDVLTMYTSDAANVDCYIDGVEYGKGVTMFQSDNRYYNISENEYIRLDKGIHKIRLLTSGDGSGKTIRVSAVRFTKSVSDNNLLVEKPSFTVNQATFENGIEELKFKDMTVEDDGSGVKSTDGYYEINSVNSTGKNVTFTFNVTDSAKYNISADMWVERTDEKTTLYSTKITDILLDGEDLSHTLQYADSDAKKWNTFDFGQAWLDKGTHKLSVKVCGTAALYKFDKLTLEKSNNVSFFAAQESENISKSNDNASITVSVGDLYGYADFAPTGVGESISFNMPVTLSGTYDVEIVVKGGQSRGKYDVYVNNDKVGATQDFSSFYTYKTITVGSVALTNGKAEIKFVCAEANSSGKLGLILSRVNLKPTEITETTPAKIPANGELFGYVDIVNNTSSEDHATLAAAFYSNINGTDKLVDIKILKKTFASGESGTVYNALHNSEKYSQTDKIKLFVWNDTENLVPLAEYSQLLK